MNWYNRIKSLFWKRCGRWYRHFVHTCTYTYDMPKPVTVFECTRSKQCSIGGQVRDHRTHGMVKRKRVCDCLIFVQNEHGFPAYHHSLDPAADAHPARQIALDTSKELARYTQHVAGDGGSVIIRLSVLICDDIEIIPHVVFTLNCPHTQPLFAVHGLHQP